MTKLDNKSKQTPADRLHAIMSGNKNDKSPINRLPKAKSVDVKPVSETAPVHALPPTTPQAETVKSKLPILSSFLDHCQHHFDCV